MERPASSATTPTIVAPPVFEHHREPLGIGEDTPRISWCTTAGPAWYQASAEIEITRGGRTDRFPIEGGASVLVPWPAAPLASRERVDVRIRVIGVDGTASPWSGSSTAEAGLLRPTDWAARPVGASWPEDGHADDRRPALVRRAFVLAEAPVSARLYVSAHGLFEAEINGTRVGREAMAPGWTPYRDRLRYLTYDVTALLRPGENVLGAWLGDGWYRGRLGWQGGFRNLYGFDQSLIAQLEVVDTGGARLAVATDDSWTAHPSPMLASGNYDGEEHDARLEPPRWSEPGADPTGWTPVAVHRRDPATLVAPTGPPVRCVEEVMPVAVLTTPSGATVLDFGVNLVGRIRIRVHGEAGRAVIIRTAEVLQDGELYTRPLRSARSTDRYVLAGRPEGEVWEPRFTMHGFRYAEVSGWPGEIQEGDLVARVYSSDLRRTGWFACSDALLERLHENVVRSMRGNFLDVPTDCPQRDERLGWTGDIQVFGPTASFLFDVSGMLASWLRDLAVEQSPDGTVPWYVPVIPARATWTPIRPGAAWGDAATVLPWTLFQRFGDTGVLEAQYDSARAWVDRIDRIAGPSHLWDTGFQLGDWLDPSAPPEDPADARADRYLVATAYFALSSRLVARMGEVLGREDDAHRYAALADAVRAAFLDAYVRPDGRMTSDAQTAYAVAIAFGLVDGDLAVRAGRRMAELVAEGGDRIGTGFVGTPLVTDALTSTGHLDAAYRLLLQREDPSWLYAVTQGATTIWERWDSLLPDGTVNPGSMTSFNHYALGAVADWMQRTVAGIAPDDPGYRRIRFAPRPGGGLTSASAAHDTPYGRTSIAWQRSEDDLDVEVTVPTGATGVVDLENGLVREVGPGVHRIRTRLSSPAGREQR